ncbi:hypothetical protein B296_00023048 [Ensete ventricosum]|uniref:Uncharacterized protein n=1 Tax=Ensete ventricosum TaxID=4639 RepID=A0A426XW80_ENSVE|nr:hypothetical protein B296_00023048 [Ensete ventricosum]
MESFPFCSDGYGSKVQCNANEGPSPIYREVLLLSISLAMKHDWEQGVLKRNSVTILKQLWERDAKNADLIPSVRTLMDSKPGVISIRDRPPWNSIGVPPSLVLKSLAKKD